MLAILIITGIIVGISLLDFYTSKNWQNVTSVTRNNAVFEKRNQSYGAYEIRKDYNRSFIIILLSVFVGGGGLTSMALAGREVKEEKTETKTYILDPTINDKKPEVEKEKEPEEKVAQKETAPPSIKWLEPVVSNTQDTFDLPDPGKKIGTEDNPDSDPNATGKKTTFTNGNDNKTVVTDSIVGSERLTEFAQFVGGRGKMLEFINDNFAPRDIETNVTVYTKFVVSSNGEVRNFKVTKVVGDCYDCESKAYELLKMMPKWIPAKVDGVPVTSYFTMPIKVKVN